jgi:hypothetical protein
MSVCEHDQNCSGAGWGHDSELTQKERADLGLPAVGELSFKKAVRMLRAYRKQLKELNAVQ